MQIGCVRVDDRAARDHGARWGRGREHASVVELHDDWAVIIACASLPHRAREDPVIRDGELNAGMRMTNDPQEEAC
ncbi:hypothetical protein [Solirubrobacter soli]|uniref:hypothetical protein n=1 Tax=Solirubrobacter soli TaxID=363832 RepID=UPI000489F80E|nr:hypothetical protein [Solirubrobacter soli]